MPSNLHKRIEATNPQGAYYGGSADNAWTSWFGRQKAHIETTPYDVNDRSTWVLPEGLNGANIMLANTLELMSFMADSWYTQEALPLESTQKTGIQWSKYLFMPKFASLVPERGVARLVRSRKTGGRATFERRGLGFLLTHGFMNTPGGQESYRMNLRQIAQSVVETNNFGVIYAYLTCDDYEKQWDKDHGTYRGDTLEKVLEVDTFLWDIFKRKNGAVLLDDHISTSMEKYRGKANMYILPPKIGRHYTIVPSNRTDYWMAGPKGPQSIYDGIESVRDPAKGLTQLKGNTIYITRTYDVEPHNSNYGRAIDILRFRGQIGEYHLAFDTRRGRDYTGYESTWRDIQIYDEDRDNFTTLSLSWMLKNCNRFHPQTGEVLHVNDPEVARNHPRFSKADQAKDVFHFVDAHKNLQKAAFIGNIEYLETTDVFEWVRTALNQLPDVVLPTAGSDGNNNSYNIWTRGMRALDDIENITYNSNVNRWFEDLAAANDGAPSINNGKGRFKNFAPTIRGFKEYAPNSYGGLNLPDAKEMGISLPPGFGNYAGFKTIANAVSSGEFEEKGYNVEKGRDIERFVNMVDRLVEGLSRMLPNNPLLAARYASSWWHKATAADTFFENLVSSHHRDPIFLTGDGGSNGGQGQKEPSTSGSVDIDDDDAFSRIGARGQGEEEEAAGEELDLNAIGEELNEVVEPYRRAVASLFADIKEVNEDELEENVRRRIISLKQAIELVLNEDWDSLRGEYEDEDDDDEDEEDASGLGTSQSSIRRSRSGASGGGGGGSAKQKEAILKRLLDEAKAKALLGYALQEAGAVNDDSVNDLADFAATLIEPNVSLGAPVRLLQGAKAFADAFLKAFGALGGKNARNKRRSMTAILTSIKRLQEDSVKQLQKGGVPRSVIHSRAKTFEYGKTRGKSDTYRRAPITMSPELFTSLYEYVASGQKAAIWPADPENPDVILTAPAFAEFAEGLGADMNADGGTTQESLIGSEMPRHEMGELFDSSSFAAIRNLKQSRGAPRSASGKIRAPQYASIGSSIASDELSTFAQGARSRTRSRRVGVSQRLAEREQRSVYARRGGSHYEADAGDEEAEDREASLRRVRGGQQFAAGVQSNIDDALGDKTEHVAFRQLMADVLKEANHPLVGSLGALFLATPTNLRNFKAFIKNNLLFPIDFLVARPHARFQTYAVIKAQKGKETGTTFMGQSNFTLGDDPNTQIHVGTYTYYSKSVITEPRNVYVARNVFVDGYEGGLGTTPYKRGPDSYNPRQNIYGSTKRKTDSVFVLAVPRGSKHYPSVIDLSGRFRSFEIRHYGLDTGDEELHYDGAYYYNRYWGWSNEEIGLSASMPSSKYINEHAIPNSIMHEGHTLYFNPSCNDFNMVRISTGHYPSEYVYAGCKRAREGGMSEYQPQNWTTGYVNV